MHYPCIGLFRFERGLRRDVQFHCAPGTDTMEVAADAVAKREELCQLFGCCGWKNRGPRQGRSEIWDEGGQTWGHKVICRWCMVASGPMSPHHAGLEPAVFGSAEAPRVNREGQEAPSLRVM